MNEFACEVPRLPEACGATHATGIAMRVAQQTGRDRFRGNITAPQIRRVMNNALDVRQTAAEHEYMPVDNI